MKTKNAIKLAMENLSTEIVALEGERAAIVAKSDWNAATEVTQLINIKFGEHLGLQSALFWINFHNEIA